MKPLSVLWVSIAFPPKSDPECLQNAKYFKYLLSGSVVVDVVTSAVPTLFMPEDPGLRLYARGCRQTVEVPLRESRVGNWLLRRVRPGALLRPDSRAAFIPRGMRACDALRHKPDIVYSRAMPISSTLLAEILRDRYDVPWVMHLSDLWEDGVATDDPAVREFHRVAEARCFSKASAICLTSLRAIAYLQGKYPQHAHKMRFFPNVYDPDDTQPSPSALSEKMALTYTGGLARPRSATSIIAAVNKLVAEDPAIADGFELLFAGQFDRANRAILGASGLPMLRNLGLLPHGAALRLQQKSDVLLALDTPGADQACFPSKLLDYMVAGRRVLGVTGRESTMFDVIHGPYGACFTYENVDGIAAEIGRLLEAFRRRDTAAFQVAAPDETYSARRNARRLRDLFASLA